MDINEEAVKRLAFLAFAKERGWTKERANEITNTVAVALGEFSNKEIPLIIFCLETLAKSIEEICDYDARHFVELLKEIYSVGYTLRQTNSETGKIKIKTKLPKGALKNGGNDE